MLTRMWNNRNTTHHWWACKRVQTPWKTVWWFLTTPNMPLPEDTAITLPGIYPKELKMYVRTKTCTWMSTAAFFIIAKADLQATRCPLVEEWISKLWYIPTIKLHSVLKGNDLPSYGKTWRKQMHISEINQSGKGYIQYDPNHTTFWKRQNYGDDEKIGVLPGGGRGWWIR